MSGKPTLGTVAIALCLSGCAGGGGGGGPSVGQPANPAGNNVIPAVNGADNFRTSEYSRMGGLDAVRAADAYALGYTGKGVTIGIVDFNFDLGSTEIAFDPASRGPDAQAQALYQAQTREAPSSDLHGFAVAAAAAARKNDLGGHGIAFDAQVLAVDYFSGVNESQVVQGGVAYHISDPWTYITSHGVRIVNTSYGYEASDIISNPPRVSEAYVVNSPAIVVENGALLVTAAGNATGVNPSLYAFDTVDDLRSAGVLDSGAGAYIIVGAVDGNNQIASFSNRAGSLANYFMVAPGTGFLLPWNGGNALLSGTSFSTPLVSGAAAIILQRWPTLTARQVASILFTSATDLGAPGTDGIYGHGLLNLAAALQPIGTSTLAAGGGAAPVVSGTSMMLGSAFGDAPAFHQALSQVMILDGFGRDFEIDLSQSARSRQTLPDLFGVMEQRFGWHSTNVALGTDARFAFDVRRNAEDGLVPFQALAGPADYSTHQSIFRFSGAADGIDWTAGTGLSLREGMASADGSNAFTALPLTNAFSPMTAAAPGRFASLRFALNDENGLSLGMSHADNQGITDYRRTPFHNSTETIAMRLDHRAREAQFAFEAGETLESGGLMGSLASGGLTMAERVSTAWTTASAQTALDAHWSLKGALTFAATSASHPEASLITEIGPVYATSFALGVAGEGIFRQGDALSFTFGQPLRAERANATLLTGVGRDLSTGGVIMGETRSSLLPSGRELDFETGYRFGVGAWSAQGNVVYAVDPDHVRQKNAVVALFTMSRMF